MAWRDLVREIPDFPEPGVLFRDVLPVLAHPQSFQEVLAGLESWVRPLKVDGVMGPEARGFLLAAPLADRLKVAVVPVRKAGKLPDPVFAEKYTLEYGENQLEVESSQLFRGRRFVIVDDVLATGGTVRACAALATRLGADVVGYAFLIELAALQGRGKLSPQSAVYSLMTV